MCETVEYLSIHLFVHIYHKNILDEAGLLLCACISTCAAHGHETTAACSAEIHPRSHVVSSHGDVIPSKYICGVRDTILYTGGGDSSLIADYYHYISRGTVADRITAHTQLW